MFARSIKLALSLFGIVLMMILTVEHPLFLGAPLKEFYNQNFIIDTGARNAVTAIYLNYRVFDTFFETLMLILSVMAVIYLSWRNVDGK